MSHVLDLIGNTPLIRLDGPSEATGCEILGKAEFLNPGGSIKDRAALGIIRAAEAADAQARADADAAAESEYAEMIEKSKLCLFDNL